jgi:hypothetical protein
MARHHLGCTGPRKLHAGRAAGFAPLKWGFTRSFGFYPFRKRVHALPAAGIPRTVRGTFPATNAGTYASRWADREE